MFKINKYILFLSLFLSFHAMSEDKIEIVLDQPIEISKSNTATGGIGSLSPAAIQQGIDEARLKGDIKYQPLADGKVRVNINWSSLIKQKGMNESNIPLDSNLVSQFITSSKQIEPNVTVMAKGDLISFSEAINDLIASENESANPSFDTSNNDEKTNARSSSSEENNTNPSPMYSDSSGGGSDVNGSDGESNAKQQDNVTVKKETWEMCNDRIDYATNTIYERAKRVVMDGNGTELERGGCEDHGESRAIGTTVSWEPCSDYYDNKDYLIYKRGIKVVVDEFDKEIERSACITRGEPTKMPLTEAWEDCPNVVNKDSGKVYQQGKKTVTNDIDDVVLTGDCENHGAVAEIKKEYGGVCSNLHDYVNLQTFPSFKEFAIINNSEFIVTNCTADITKVIPLVTDTNECNLRHEFLKNRSVQQWKYFYTENGENVDASECVDSDITYNHFQTTNGCTAVVDTANGIVFPSKRTAYKLNDGIIEYASDCAPVGTESVALSTEFCSQKYEHDISAGQSYRRIRAFYNDFTTNEKIYASNCVRDSSISYAHIKETNSCSFINNDSERYSVMNALTQINTSDDGVIVVAPCQQVGGRIYYPAINSGVKRIGSKVANDCSYNYHTNYLYSGSGCPSSYDQIDRSMPECSSIQREAGPSSNKTTVWGLDVYRLLLDTYYRRGDGSTFISTVDANTLTCGQNT